MLSWFKKLRYRPCRPEGNPGLGPTASLPLAAPATPTETLNIVQLLSATLHHRGIAHRSSQGWLRLDDGLMLLPEFLSLEYRPDGGAKTSTTISVCHADHLPAGLFEYQHSVGGTAADALRQGFDHWIRLDLKTLMEALKGRDADCMSMEMSFPGTGESPPFKRRVVLGPTMDYVEKTAASIETDHPFCPCCLFRSSFGAFKGQLEGKGLYGLRLFASRDADGLVQADCRVNGIDWPAGAEELVRYVQTWPDRGLEFRKQFVVIQPAPTA